MTSKGTIDLVHLYPREMSIYGDLGNIRCLAQRIRRHGYDVRLHDHTPGSTLPDRPHLFMGGGGQDSGQSRVEDDLALIADRLRGLASDGTPMIMICGLYQLFGNAFVTVGGEELPGLGILDVTTRGNPTRMIGGIVLDTDHGEVVGRVRPGPCGPRQQRFRRHRGRGDQPRDRVVPPWPHPPGQPSTRRPPHRSRGGAGDGPTVRAG